MFLHVKKVLENTRSGNSRHDSILQFMDISNNEFIFTKSIQSYFIISIYFWLVIIWSPWQQGIKFSYSFVFTFQFYI